MKNNKHYLYKYVKTIYKRLIKEIIKITMKEFYNF